MPLRQQHIAKGDLPIRWERPTRRLQPRYGMELRIACKAGDLVDMVGSEPQHIGLPLYLSEQTCATTR
jgi:hypothetical protein